MARKDSEPHIDWYHQRWLNDGKLLRCSYAAQGVWVRLICLMESRGGADRLTVESDVELQHLLPGDPQEVLDALYELIHNRVCDTITQPGQKGLFPITLVSRLRHREAEQRKSATARKMKSRAKSVTQTSRPYPEDVDDATIAADHPDAVFIFPPHVMVNNPENRAFIVTKDYAIVLQKAYPGVDLARELSAMLSWCVSNPTRCKTPAGFPRFVNTWLARSQDRGTHNPRQRPAPSGGRGNIRLEETHRSQYGALEQADRGVPVSMGGRASSDGAKDLFRGDAG